MKNRIKETKDNSGKTVFTPQHKWIGLIWLDYRYDLIDIPVGYKTRAECIKLFNSFGDKSFQYQYM